MELIVSILTSTQAGGFAAPETWIAYKRNGEPAQVKSYELTETPALLAFTSEIIAELEPDSELIICSRPNTFTNPVNKGWIVAWRNDGFRTKPSEHREEWKRWDKMVEDKRIAIRVPMFSDKPCSAADETELSEALSNRSKAVKPRPGNPVETPWARPESVDDLVKRAAKKDRK